MHWAESIPDAVVDITRCDGVSCKGVGVAVWVSGARWEVDAAFKDGGTVWGTRRRRFKSFGGRAKSETALLDSVVSGVLSCCRLVAVC